MRRIEPNSERLEATISIFCRNRQLPDGGSELTSDFVGNDENNAGVLPPFRRHICNPNSDHRSHRPINTNNNAGKKSASSFVCLSILKISLRTWNLEFSFVERSVLIPSDPRSSRGRIARGYDSSPTIHCCSTFSSRETTNPHPSDPPTLCFRGMEWDE